MEGLTFQYYWNTVDIKHCTLYTHTQKLFLKINPWYNNINNLTIFFNRKEMLLKTLL